MRMGTGLLVTSDLLMVLAYSNPSITPILILICVLRNFLPCASRDHSVTANGGAGNSMATNHAGEKQEEPRPLVNADGKPFITVV